MIGNTFLRQKDKIFHVIPKTLGIELVIRVMVNADHAGDKKSGRSRMGFFVIVNNAPVNFLSLRSTFGSKFLAMKACCEYLRGLRVKITCNRRVRSHFYL